MGDIIGLAEAGATLLTDDDGRPYIQVELKFGERGISFTIHQSLVYAHTLNVEIDGDFSNDLGLRVNLNDGLIYDARLGLPGIEDSRDRILGMPPTSKPLPEGNSSPRRPLPGRPIRRARVQQPSAHQLGRDRDLDE